MLLGVLDGDLVLANTIVNGHGKVGKGSEGGDEGSQDVEHAFLLRRRQCQRVMPTVNWNDWYPYNWDTECHRIEGNGRDKHDNEDNPDICQYGCLEMAG